MDLSALSRAAVIVPEPLREACATVRVRLMRDRSTQCTWRTPAPAPVEAPRLLEAALVAAGAQPGDTLRIEWLDGAGDPLRAPEGVKGSVRVPSVVDGGNVSTGPAAPAPAAPRPTVTADAKVETFPQAAPPELPTRGNVSSEPPPPWPDGATTDGPMLAAAGGQLLARSVSALEGMVSTQAGTIDRLLGAFERQQVNFFAHVSDSNRVHAQTAQVAVGQVGNTAGAFAREHGKAVDGLSTMGARAVDVASSNASHAAELNGELLGRAHAAIDARIDAEIRAAGAAAAAEPTELEPGAQGKNLPDTLEAVGNLIDKGAAAVRSATGDAARQAIADVVSGMAAGKEPPAELRAAVARLTPEQKATLAATLASMAAA